jgi:hypothetical protein
MAVLPALCSPVVSIERKITWLGFLLVALGRRSLGFLINVLGLHDGRPKPQRALNRLLAIQRSGLAVSTGVRKVLTDGFLPVLRVEAINVLPCVACLAVYRVAVVVGEIADTLDGVWLFLWRLHLVGDIVGAG